jgi:hypothetical protein
MTSARSTVGLSIAIGALAAWLDCGRLHYLQDADSLLPVLVSTQHWTPFFWGQDRFGMLVPLIATPFHHPFVNLLVQGWLTIAAALAAPFLIARYLGADRYWIAAGALANACLLLMLSTKLQFEWLVAQPYALSMTLAIASLLLLDRWTARRSVVAFALMLLALWVNLGAAVAIVPLVLVRMRPATRPLLVTAVAVAAGALLRHASAAPPTTTRVLPLGEWPSGWLELLHTVSRSLAHPLALIIVALLAVCGAVVVLMDGRRSALVGVAAKGFIAAVAYWLVVGALDHVRLNEYYPRYVLPSVVLFAVSMACLIVAAARRPTVAARGAFVAVALAAVVTYGAPSLTRLSRTLDRTLGALTPDLLATGATVIAGDYWTVWPAVFHTNEVLYGNATHAEIFGLSYRSEVTDPTWLRRAETKRIVLAAPQSDKRAPVLLDRLSVPVRPVGDHGALRLYAIGRGRE